MAEMNFLSNWEGVKSVPKNYVFPPEKRPCVAVKKTIPVIDFATNDRALLFQRILDVTQEFGFFQVINHGVSKQLIEETMKTLKEFNSMSPEDKKRECSKDPDYCKVYPGSQNSANEQTHFWRDSMSFNCNPLEKYIHFWPGKPPEFREVVGAYCVAMRKFVLELLDVISEGLKLGRGYLGDEMSSNPTMFVHYYPPCPDPSLTLGLRQHCDGSLITILFQDVNGLQILKDGEWIAADPIDDALLINFGYVLEVISNGKLKAAEHRAMTNMNVSRQSLIYFVCPENDVTIEPAKCLINETNPLRYRTIKYEDFRGKYHSVLANKEEIMKFMSLNNP